MSAEHLMIFLVEVFQEPLVLTTALIVGFAIALLFGNAVVGIIRKERG